MSPAVPAVWRTGHIRRRHRGAQSKAGANLIYKYPILLDACANEMQLKGDSMMSKCAAPSPSYPPSVFASMQHVAVCPL